jgi:hypothetical protein
LAQLCGVRRPPPSPNVSWMHNKQWPCVVNHVVHTAVRDMHAPFSIDTQAETRANIWQPWPPNGCTWRAYLALAVACWHSHTVSEFADTIQMLPLMQPPAADSRLKCKEPRRWLQRPTVRTTSRLRLSCSSCMIRHQGHTQAQTSASVRAS